MASTYTPLGVEKWQLVKTPVHGEQKLIQI